ncbi:MAG: sugar kinase [Acidobacteria bacterium]|nr:MAG: sugar kinase [Acidobacteriota bacterium]
MAVLVVGSVALDSVRTPFGERREVLGGSATYFSVAASFFTPVKLVAVVGEDFADEHRRLLTERGIDLSGLQAAPGRTFRWKGEYGYDLNVARTLRTELNVFAGFRPSLPEHYRDCEYVFLANIDPDLQREVLEQVRSPRLVACDTMDFWIAGKRESLLRTIRRVDILLINDAEARQLSGESSLVRAAQTIRALGPKALVVKRGEYGAMLFSESSVFAAPAYPLEAPVDPTGAGDSFAGGFIGHLASARDLSEKAMRRAIIFGSVMASFDVEDFSLGRLVRLSREEIHERYRAFSNLTQFEAIPEDAS